MTDKEFVNGMIAKAPHENAPEFVKACVSIKVKDLGNWLRERSKAGDEWVNVDIKEARSGKWYAEVNTYSREGGDRGPTQTPAETQASTDDVVDDDIPF